MMLKTICSCLALSFALLAQELPSAMRSNAANSEKTYRIAGMVVDMVTGEPLPHTEISIALTFGAGRFRDAVSVESGPDGRFSFSPVNRGKYLLTARRRGYSLQSFEQHDELSTAIVTGEGLDSEHFLFRLRPDASIRGRVTDGDNDPVEWASVYIATGDSRTGEQKMRLIHSVSTDDRGEYVIPHIAPGTYYLAVVAKPWYATPHRASETAESTPHQGSSLDLAFPMTYYPDTTSFEGAQPIKLQAGDAFTADFLLQAVPALHMQVLGPSHDEGAGGQNTAGIRTGPFGRRYPEIQQSVFGTLIAAPGAAYMGQGDGSLEVAGLAPGEYKLSMHGTQGEPTSVQTVELRSSAKLDALHSGKRVAVSGSVHYGHEPKPDFYNIVLYERKTGKSHVAASNKKEFTFAEPLEPGTYEVMVHSRSNLFLAAMRAEGAKVNGRTLTLGGSAEATLEISLSSGIGEVSGVAMIAGKPSAAVMVVLVPNDPKHNLALFRRDQSDSDGTFLLPNVVPGTYSVVALSGAWDLEWLNADVLQSYLQQAVPVVVDPGSKKAVTVEVQKVSK